MTHRDKTSKLDQPEKKISRWWMVFHFWSGSCVYLLFDISGLLDFLVNLIGSELGDPSNASFRATVAALISVLAIYVGYSLSIKLTEKIISPINNRVFKFLIITAYPIIFLEVSVGLAFIVYAILNTNNSNTQVTPPLYQQAQSEIFAFTTSQDFEGITETNLDQEALNVLEEWVVSELLEKGRLSYAAQGFDPKDYSPRVEANSVYVTASGKKLAIMKIDLDGIAKNILVLGVAEGQLIKVSCIREGQVEIPVWSGACEEEITRSLGVSINI